MTYNFDEEIDRFGTQCTKWEFEYIDEEAVKTDRAHAKYGAERLLPLWVADMDFQSPPEVIAALEERAAHGLYGYCTPDDSYYDAVLGWMARRYGLAVERDWIAITPGVVTALYLLVQTFSEPGDKVLIQPPVYYPFYNAIADTGRVVALNPLQRDGLRYEMDYEDLARKTADPAVKIAILCSPHNPVGRVWTPQELTRFGQICQANDVLVIADEIHGDLILAGHQFTSYPAISAEFAASSILCTAPSKTFNLAGLKLSNILIANADLRARYAQTLNKCHLSTWNVFNLVATEAAYRHGEPWLAEVMAYIEENYRFLVSYVEAELPWLTVYPLEGTYLAWIDFSGLGMDPARRQKWLIDEAKVWLNEGAKFGPGGEDFQRLNLACPRSLLAEALARIKTAVPAEHRVS